MARHSVGFVYVLGNDDMPDLVKIGRSSRLPEDRAKEGFTTFVPSPFKVLFRAVTSHPAELERAVHGFLAPHRNPSKREFFRVSTGVAVDSIVKMRSQVDGIDTWSAHSRIVLRSGDRLLLAPRAGQIFALLAYAELLAPSAAIVDLWHIIADDGTLEIYVTNSPGHVAGLGDGDPGAEDDPVPFLNRTGTAGNDAIDGRERLVPGDRLLWMDASSDDGACISVILETNDYCQVVSRSRRRQSSQEVYPPLNIFTAEKVPIAMVRAIRQALALPIPRSWAPRCPDESAGWGSASSAPPSPEHWLPQLADRRRASKRSRKRKNR